MQVVILCGGQGTRAYPYTRSIPKALLEVDGVPIVEQVMRIYAAQGYRQFVLSCGYLKERLFEYFADGKFDWDVQCVDTGGDADTGERIIRLLHLLGDRFHATYCDGLGDVDLHALEDFHRSHTGLGTLTVARLRSQYGLVYADGDGRVTGFEEKPVLPDRWLNGGYFVFDRAAFEQYPGRNLERDILPALSQAGRLYEHQHTGFWRSMDTFKDQQELNEAWLPYSERYAPAGANAALSTVGC